MTVAEFCEGEGRFECDIFWVEAEAADATVAANRGRRPAGEKAGEARPYRQVKSSATRSNGPFVQLPLSVAAASPGIEVVLAEGAVVRLPQQNLAALQTVLRTLGGTDSHGCGTGEVRHA